MIRVDEHREASFGIGLKGLYEVAALFEAVESEAPRVSQRSDRRLVMLKRLAVRIRQVLGFERLKSSFSANSERCRRLLVVVHHLREDDVLCQCSCVLN